MLRTDGIGGWVVGTQAQECGEAQCVINLVDELASTANFAKPGGSSDTELNTVADTAQGEARPGRIGVVRC
jgi:hypothetical protein